MLFLSASKEDVSTLLVNSFFQLSHTLYNTLKCVKVFAWKLSWQWCLAHITNMLEDKTVLDKSYWINLKQLHSIYWHEDVL